MLSLPPATVTATIAVIFAVIAPILLYCITTYRLKKQALQKAQEDAFVFDRLAEAKRRAEQRKNDKIVVRADPGKLKDAKFS